MPPSSWRRRIVLPDHLAGGHPLLPEGEPAPAAGGGAAPPPALPPSGDPAPAAPPGSDPGSSDPGFPAGTPVADMTPEQAAAYWKTQARKHEGRHLEALGFKSTAELEQLRKDAADAAELRKSQMTDHELAIAAARDQAASETRQTYGGRLAVAEFRAASGGSVTAELLQELRIDPTSFLTDDGEPDSAAIAAVVARIAPTPQTAPPLHTGGGTSGTNTTLADRVAAATKDGDLRGSIALKVGALPTKRN